MIYEIRTYDLKPRSMAEFERRTEDKLDARKKYSQVGGYWQTEVGPLNQVVHIWPYDDLNQRGETRKKVIEAGIWPPDTGEFILNMNSEIYIPAEFMKPFGERDLGPLYEMRSYTYPPGVMPQVLEAWTGAIEAREKLSPLAGCWYSELGGLNKLVHMWAYRSPEERARIRAESVASGVWPPKAAVTPLTMENKLMLPFKCSPMQ
jgi:hypothetical protein